MPLTTFQYWSTARMVMEKGVPAICAFGVPSLPSAVPLLGVSPGRSTWSFLKDAGFTRMLPLVPVRAGDEKSVHVSRTEEPAAKSVTCPLQTPAAKLIRVGELVPVPVLEPSTASPA